jgi:hypothetical protein
VFALAGCILLSACGARPERAADKGIDAPGFLVFSGMTSSSYLHAIRPDGSDLREVALPQDCSPDRFTRDGRNLLCFDLNGDAGFIALERKQASWHQAPLPAEFQFPDWAIEDDMLERAPEWAPNHDQIAFIRPPQSDDTDFWLSQTGDVVVAGGDNRHEKVVAEGAQVPAWSPDGRSLAFARCRPSELTEGDWRSYETAECSLWVVRADGSHPPELLVENAASIPVWSPDSRFIAFLREVRCEIDCIDRIFVLPADGGKALPVGPELVKPRGGFEWWRGLAWVPESAPVVSGGVKGEPIDWLALQRCVDIWNRARMYPWPAGALNVSLVGDRCQMTVAGYGGVCTQSASMEFRYWCQSHGAGLHLLPPEHRVWNADAEEDGQVRLFDPPQGPRLPLPKAPPYPMLDGFVVPYGKDGEPLEDLKLTEVKGTCYGTGEPDRYPLALPDGYPARCWGHGSGNDHCFKRPGRLALGDTVLCPMAVWDDVYDPMRFFKVKVVKFE